MKKKKRKSGMMAFSALCVIAVFTAFGAYTLFSPISKSEGTTYLYIDNDDDADSVYIKLESISTPLPMAAFRILSYSTGYSEHIRPGRYGIEDTHGMLQVFRNMRNGTQSPVMLTIPSVRTMDRLASELGKKLMVSREDILSALSDNGVCQRYGLDTLTIPCLFIPETYEVYWNISVAKLLDRMDKERKHFWNADRRRKAEEAGLSETEVMTLASIVDEETANNGEKPMVAGMYINRLKCNMPLQADPTIKFAWQRFELRRIYHNLLNIDSPYNTYRNTGLPPGPIRIPSVAGIDAVLNYTKSRYLYMCAKEDFSGTHNFAETYPEHLRNAARYTAALNARGIK